MDRPPVLPFTQLWFDRLPDYLRNSDESGDLIHFMSLIGDQADEILKEIDAISFYPLDDGGAPGDTSALVDPTKAGELGDPYKHLKWLSQLVGARLNQADSIDAQIDAIRFASAGWKAGTRQALADAATSVLTGTRYVSIEPEYAGDPWAIAIRTRASETPDDTAVVNAILSKRAKPAGFVLINVSYSASWDTLESLRAEWDQWDGFSWITIEETGLPGDDAGNIPPPDSQSSDTNPGIVIPFLISTSPSNKSVDVDPTLPYVATFSDMGTDPSTITAVFTKGDGTVIPIYGYNDPSNPNFPDNDDYEYNSAVDSGTNSTGGIRKWYPVGGSWPSGETVTAALTGAFVPPGFGSEVVFPIPQDPPFQFTVKLTDIVPPTVITTMPLQGSTGIALNSLIDVVFSEDIDQTTLTSSSIVLTAIGGGTIATTRIYDSPSKTLTITPTGTILNGTGYLLSLTTAIKDLAGNAMATGFQYSWTTVTAPTQPTPPPIATPFVKTYEFQPTTALDYVNDWWAPYDGASTWNAGTFRKSQIVVDTAAKVLNINGIQDSTKKAAGALSNLIAGGVAMGRRKIDPKIGGAVEFYVRCDKGNGFGPAIFLWPDSNVWPKDGEDDGLEVPRGNRQAGTHTIHYQDSGGTGQQIGRSTPGSFFPSGIDYSQWHTVRIEHLPNRISEFVDGIKINETTDVTKIPTGSKLHPVIQMDMGKAGMNWIDLADSTTPSLVRLQIGWIKVYDYKP